jgi:hypothetical protein
MMARAGVFIVFLDTTLEIDHYGISVDFVRKQLIEHFRLD